MRIMAPVQALMASLGSVVGWSVSLPLWAIMVLAVAVAVACWLGGRKLGNRLLQAELDGARLAAVVLNRELEQSRDLVANSERRRMELFEKIAGIVEECNSWRKLYWSEASLHGTAQAMLMDERNYFLAQFKRLKMKPRTNATIDKIVAMHEAEHAGPSREALEELAREQKIATGKSEGSEVASGASE